MKVYARIRPFGKTDKNTEFIQPDLTPLWFQWDCVILSKPHKWKCEIVMNKVKLKQEYHTFWKSDLYYTKAAETLYLKLDCKKLLCLISQLLNVNFILEYFSFTVFW